MAKPIEQQLNAVLTYIVAARRDNVLSRVKLLLRDEIEPRTRDALALLKQQPAYPKARPSGRPEPTEFTKEAKEYFEDTRNDIQMRARNTALEALGIIDKLSAENKKLNNQKEYIYKPEIKQLKARMAELEGQDG